MNLYPMFTQKRLLRDAAGRLRIRMPYASGDLVVAPRAALFRALRRAAFHLGDGVARLARAAGATGSTALSRPRGELRAGGRSARRIYLVADVRPRRLGLSPGPAAAGGISRPDGPVGHRSRLGSRSRRGSRTPLVDAYPRSIAEGGTAAVGPQRGVPRFADRLAARDTMDMRDVSQLLPCRLRRLDGVSTATANGSIRWSATGHDSTVERRLSRRSRRSASTPPARPSAGRSSTSAGRYDFSSPSRPSSRRRAGARRRSHLGSLPLRLSARRRPLERPTSRSGSRIIATPLPATSRTQAAGHAVSSPR